MNLSSLIANRYFFSRKKKNFIHILTIISVSIVAVCTASLIVVLSVFNGLEDLLKSLNNSFDPEIKISLIQGKSFSYDENLKGKITSIEGIDWVTEVIEDYAYVKYKDSEMVVTMKGVSPEFISEKRIDESIIRGEAKLKDAGFNYAIIGLGVHYFLSTQLNDEITPMQVHYIKDIKRGSLSAGQSYSKKSIYPIAIFSIQKYFDENYIFVPLDFAEELLDYGDRRTSLEIKTAEGYSIEDVKIDLVETLGKEFRVLDPDEQHADLYKLLQIEKLFVFIALVLILSVGSINILFVLSMLAIDKKADIAVLFSMGTRKSTIRNIFLKEGFMISLTGTIIGLFLGWLLGFLQQEVGLIGMGMETAVQSSYPIKMQWIDFLWTSLSVIILTFLVSYRPASLATKYSNLEYLPG